MIATSIKPYSKIYADDSFDKGIIFESVPDKNSFYKPNIKKIAIVDGQHFINPEIFDFVFWEVGLPDFQTRFISNSVELVFGRTSSDFYNIPNLIKSIVFFDDKEKFEEAINDAIRFEKTTLKKRIFLPDGTIQWVVDKLYVSYDNFNNPVSLYGISSLIDFDANSKALVEDDRSNLNILLNNMKDIAFSIDNEGKWTYLNPAWEKLTGYSCDESIGRKFIEFLHIDDIEFNSNKFIPLINQAIHSVNHIVRFISKSGLVIETEIFAGTIFSKNNSVIGVSGIIKEIGSNSSSLDLLRQSCERDRLLLNSIPDLFLILDCEGYISDYNISDKSRLVFSPSEFINKPISHIFPNDLADEFIKKINFVIKTGKTSSFDYSFLSGKIDYYYEARITKLSPTKVVALIRNIEQQKLVEQKLEKLVSLNLLINGISSDLAQAPKNKFNRTINLSLAQLGIFTEVDRVYIFNFNFQEKTCDNTYEWCADGINAEISNLQGISFEKFPRWMKIFKSNNYIYIPSVENIDPRYSTEKEILESQGIKSLIASPMFYNGLLIGFIGYDSVKNKKSWDEDAITLLKLSGDIFAAAIKRSEFENLLIEQKTLSDATNKAKSKFLANISNEIRTPLNSILGFSELLLNSDSEVSDLNYTNKIYSKTKNLLSLINNILDLSRIEAGMIESKLESMSVKVLLSEIRQIFFQKAHEKDIELLIDVQEGFPDAIYFDDIRLKQILFKLVGNAIKFTKKGSIKVCADITYGLGNGIVDMRFQIADTGIGMSEDKLQNIFDKYQQINNDDGQKYDGTGFGLAITKKLTDLLGGSVSVKSEENIGSTFTIEFKKVKVSSDNLSYDDDINSTNSITFNKSKILIIDEVEYNRELIKVFLQPYDFVVVEALNCKDAIDMIELTDFDLVLIDFNMLLINSEKTTETFSKFAKNKAIPMIALTSSYLNAYEPVAQNLFVDYLKKPLTKTELINSLVKFLPNSDFKIKSTDYDRENDINFLVAQNLVDSIEHNVLIKFLETYKQNHEKQIKEIHNHFDSGSILQAMDNFNDLTEQYGIEAFSDIIVQIKDATISNDLALISQSVTTILKSIDYCKIIIDLS